MFNDLSLFFGDRRQGDTRAVTDCTTALQPEMMQLNGKTTDDQKTENETPLGKKNFSHCQSGCIGCPAKVPV